MKRLLIPFAILAFNVHAAGIQKWVDESGQIHYGDSPPAKVESEQIRVTRPPSNPGRTLPRLGDEQDAQNNQDEAAAPQQEQEEVPQASEDEKRDFCEKARDDLTVINRNQRIRLRSPDGTTRYMTSEEIEERRARTEADIELYCQ